MTKIACQPRVSSIAERRSERGSVPRATPFRSAEQAWHWAIAALLARREGTCRRGVGLVRPCDPDDIIRSLDQLYRGHRISLLHARVLRVWGERQSAPDAKYPSERTEARLWLEALERLEWPLRIKGIVV